METIDELRECVSDDMSTYCKKERNTYFNHNTMKNSYKKSTEKFPPRWIERMKSIIPHTEWDTFLEHCTDPLPKTIRIINITKNNNFELKKTSIQNAFFYNSPTPIGKTIPHFCGEWYSSSLSSLLAVECLDPKPNEKILDMCASPGSKTTFIADKMENTGVLIANEIKRARIPALQQNILRMGVHNTIITQYDATQLPDFFGEEFDRILLDAPCSGDGFGRKDKNFYRTLWKEKNITFCAQLQKKLITSAFEMLNLGGEMIYSTCTGAPEENEMIVQFLLDTYPEAELIPITLANIPHTNGIHTFEEQEICTNKTASLTYRFYPHLRNTEWDSEFFFIARIRKKELTQRSFTPPDIPSSPYQKLKKNQRAEIISFLSKTFGIDRTLFGSQSILEYNETFILAAPDISWLLKRIKAEFVGLPLLEKGIITNHFAIHFGKQSQKNTIIVSPEEGTRFLYGYTVEAHSQNNITHPEQVLIRTQDHCLGFGKRINQSIKNKLDRWRILH